MLEATFPYDYESEKFDALQLQVWVLQVLQGLEVATICVEDMDEWLGIFNIKLRHMREDIQSVIFLTSSSPFNFRITIS